MTAQPRLRRLPGLAAALLLTACSATLGGGPAPHLYQVAPATVFPASLPHVAAQLLIDQPLAPAALDTQRIALTQSPISIDYFADSAWTDRVPAIVQAALVESFENSRAVTALDRESAGLHADFILKTEIRHFEAVYDSPNAPPEVRIEINARLIKEPQGVIIAQTSVLQRQRAAANDITHIVTAFNAALGAVMRDLVVWTLGNPALSRARS